ncbi:glycoside hydrolase family 32 protein [Acutalibacter sp. 1XD8-33]|uniref:glycoside hydrolase family 32 protein n=1 Tax=Acutalibacter sp. 1XD8-33 TaxID=2320081 RepID=UPI000EA078C5|nr:glycoside hydrolase family 32 protein [Acutalibacter sp. 1XD8-33]RKJ41194.1 glycoside hydrolase family 32 protein [Acutalibacter sp. 1XD8-33]
MSTQGIRDFRPELHYTPKTGWINDPNGLIFAQGKYHLFAQYGPEPHWGDLHWSHAVSGDLLHWEHLSPALAPDEMGMMFSGSAILDQENASGLGEEGRPPILLFYTAHGDHEQQCLAYSLDGVNFTKYPGNPIIPNTEIQDFRDPKVFPNPIKGGWTMALAVGDHVEFYASSDLLHWEKTGDFGPQGNYSEGVWECPDLFPLEVEGKTLWVLLVSMGPNPVNHGARTQYFTGTFDGDTFRCDGRFTQAEFIDAGFDNYAGVTFANLDRQVLVGWAANPVYAGNLPTGEFCCQHTLPRELSLVNTETGGIRLAQKPAAQAFGPGVPGSALPGEVFQLTVTGKGACTVTLSNEDGEAFRFGVDEANRAFADRTQAGAQDFDGEFAADWSSRTAEPRFYQGEWTMELVFDHSVCELFVDNGTRTFTQLVYPNKPYTHVEAGAGAEVLVHGLK